MSKNKKGWWTARQYSDAEIIRYESEVSLEDEVDLQSQSTNSVARNETSASDLPRPLSMDLNTNSQMLEGTLSRRRSDTRVYKCNTRLIECIPDGDIKYISNMLTMGANPNATCRLSKISACHIAAMYNNNALATLIGAGAETSRPDKFGRTPLHIAAWAGNVKDIAILLNFPEALREKVVSDLSPATLEEVKRHSSVVLQLTNAPCEPDMQPTPDAWSDSMEHDCRSIKLPLLRPGWTALHVASARAHRHCVQLLLAAGANACAQDIFCCTPLDVVGFAHYMEHKIDVSNFKDTIRILLKVGKIQNPNLNALETPLHTAVELESEETADLLLNGGASATNWDSHGLTAMHVCVKKRCKEMLQMLVNYEYSDENTLQATVDAKDQLGYTALHTAVREEWHQGVCIALGAGADITIKANNGETAIHSAAALGNMDILQEILTVAKFNSTIDFPDDKGETALFIAIRCNKIDVVKLLLETGANIRKLSCNKRSVFHIAAKYGDKDILEHLLKYDISIVAEMINLSDSNTYTPIVHAVTNNHPECVELLISKGAMVDFKVIYKNGIGEADWSTLLHIAASKNYLEIARIIIDHDKTTIRTVNSEGLLPLHKACSHGYRNMITLLLKNGADLSGYRKGSKAKLTPINIIMNNVSKPTLFMQEIFDNSISSKSNNLLESDCKITVDYSILVPNKHDGKQMRVIKALVNTGNNYDQNRLLLHPLVQSFLYLKWKALLPFFYTILALHGCFVLALNVFVVSVFYYQDKEKMDHLKPYLRSDIWKYVVYVSICFITLQEVIFIKIMKRRYLLCLETWLKLWAIALAVVLLQMVSWEKDSRTEYARLIASLALLFSWFEMMFLLARFPNWGFYVLMFGKVASKVCKILLSFFFLIFGFSICFMIQYHAKAPFEGPWASFVKTMVMMTSEYDYQSFLSRDIVLKVSTSIIILRVIFLTFLIAVSIVLMNLIVGVAVNNVNHLEMIGSIKRLEKQIEFITSFEDIVCHKVIRKFLPERLYIKWLMSQKLNTEIFLRPRDAKCLYYKRLPAHIREAIFEIFEKSQLNKSQKKQMNEELDTMEFKIKLNEIYNAIVRKAESESEKPVTIVQIENIHSDIEFIKNTLLFKQVRRHNSSYK